MPSKRQPIPENWTAYERGGRAGSADSHMSHDRIHFDEESQEHHERDSSADDGLLHPAGAYEPSNGTNLRHRRSSMSVRIQSLRQIGGVNSIDNFTRSWQRAAAFPEIRPVRPSFRFADHEVDEEHGNQDEEQDPQSTPRDPRSLLREAFAQQGRKGSDSAMSDEPGTLGSRHNRGDSIAAREREPLLQERLASIRDDSVFSIEPAAASGIGGSYGTTWGSLSSRVNEPAMRHAGRLFREQQLRTTVELDREHEPLLVKKVEDENGQSVNVIVGQSTLPQTIFNSINILIGIGLLALPLALQYSGLVPGLIFFAFATSSTMYTAKLLAKCLDIDNSLVTFADLAYVSFGSSARIATSILFSLELLATCVALVVLFADSLDALTNGSWGLTEWKVVCGFILIPLAFVPLRYLSVTSILGIVSCFGIVLAIFVDGLIKPEQPGSLRSPAKVHIFPDNWLTLPISFGLLMSPWGGHSVFPNIYRDMRHPYKYGRAVNTTYAFTFVLDLFMAVIGLLMFGDGVKDEITRNILITKGYPEWVSLVIVVCVAIIPLTKIPLNARPIVSTIELSLGLDTRSLSTAGESMNGLSSLSRGILKATVRIVCVVVFVILAILVPEFDRIISLLGAIACFTICIILPVAFHLKLYGPELTMLEKTRDWALIAVSTVLALVSTAFNVLPKEALGLA